MSIASTLQRVATINQVLSNPTVALTGGTAAPSAEAPTTGPTFATTLAQASATTPLSTPVLGSSTPAGSPTLSDSPALVGSPALAGSPTLLGSPNSSSSPGAQLVAAAETQVGQTEQPPGSNESPAIAQYRSATVGAVPGAPWCAYFASWAARQAGEPLGAQGEGLGSVSGIWSWAQSTGRAIPNGPGVTPRPGDLIVFGGEHVGIVRGVLPNGKIQTIEGNYENKVALNERPPGEATGYVEMS